MTPRAAFGAALVVVGVTCSGGAQAERTVKATVEQPRAFGHVLGDVLTQRVLLDIDGRDAGNVALPQAGRVGVWVERRPSRVVKDARGRSWMIIEYQVTNAARNLMNIELPAVDLKAATGAVLHVAAWPVSIGPLTPRAPLRNGDLQSLRPDRLVVPAEDASVYRRMIVMIALLVGTLASWAAWWSWTNRRDARQRPFARAWQAIQKTGHNDQNDAAWIHLHRALDETAGQVVHAASLDALLARAPFLQALKPRIDEFYARSQERFFIRDAPTAPFALRDLAKALYRAERRQ